MITFAAYSIRKAYKNKMARRRKGRIEKCYQDSMYDVDDGLQLDSPASSYRPSREIRVRPVIGGFVNYSPSELSIQSQVDLTSPASRTSCYSASVYSQRSVDDLREEMRKYQSYVQGQSYEFEDDDADDIPTYHEVVVEQELERNPSWKSPYQLPRRSEIRRQIRDRRRLPLSSVRIVELDSSSDTLNEMRNPRFSWQSSDTVAELDSSSETMSITRGKRHGSPSANEVVELDSTSEPSHQIRQRQQSPLSSVEIAELDSSSVSLLIPSRKSSAANSPVSRSRGSPASHSPAARVPLRLFNPRRPLSTVSIDQTVSPPVELCAATSETSPSPSSDRETRKPSSKELRVMVPRPLRIRKSMLELPALELPANEIFPALPENEELQTASEPERPQLKRARSASGSSVESEDNEEIVVRGNTLDRKSRPVPKRMPSST